MNPVRLGIIGCGNIGNHHAGYLLAGKVRHAVLTAVADAAPERCAKYPQLRAHTNPEELFKPGVLDAVLIATPHFQHASLGIAALEAGLHILVEKPIAAHKADAERLIAASRRHPNQIFAAMFQMRIEPRYQLIRKILHDELGKLVRVHWTLTDWFRTEAYYASGGWRATWRGEGGGVLINQCLHQLDLLQWLCGMPSRVRGFCQMGRYHSIEVEDNLSAYLEFPGGATGTLIASTGEAPGTNRLEIVGTRGKIVLENDRLTIFRNKEDMLEFSRSSATGFGKPELNVYEPPFQDAEMPHAQITQNFVNAIVQKEPLLVPGTAGLHSIELANAILYSSLINATVDLPLDGAAYETRLNELIANSTHQKQVREVKTEDFEKSFRK